MGCDIHAYTEWFDANTGNWYPGEPWLRGPHETDVPYELQEWCSDRHYNLFGWLADVRNGTWGEPLPYVPPRGLPSDCCIEIFEAYHDHSQSWISYSELWERWLMERNIMIKMSGTFHPTPEWLALPERERPAPTAYGSAGWSHEGEIKRHSWYESVEDLIGEYVNRIIDHMQRVLAENETDQVRMVFWFDS